jgi:hypothetical protein
MRLITARTPAEIFGGDFISRINGIIRIVIAGASNRKFMVNNKSAMGASGHSYTVTDETNLMMENSIPDAVTRQNGIIYFLKVGFSGNECRSFRDPQNEIR